MKALRFERSIPRFAAANLASRLGAGSGAKVGPLRLRANVDAPSLPAATWQAPADALLLNARQIQALSAAIERQMAGAQQ